METDGENLCRFYDGRYNQGITGCTYFYIEYVRQEICRTQKINRVLIHFYRPEEYLDYHMSNQNRKKRNNRCY